MIFTAEERKKLNLIDDIIKLSSNEDIISNFGQNIVLNELQKNSDRAYLWTTEDRPFGKIINELETINSKIDKINKKLDEMHNVIMQIKDKNIFYNENAVSDYSQKMYYLRFP